MLFSIGTVLFIGSILSHAFFDSLLPVLFIAPFATAVYLKKRKKTLLEKRKERLKKQFLYAASLLSDYLKSGYSIENAVLSSRKELSEVFGPKSDIAREWAVMAARMSINATAEEVFNDFGIRSGVEQIRDFTEVFSIVKRSGGQLSEVLSSASSVLAEQFSAEEQIRTAITAQKLEQKIMDIVPAAILLYVKTCSPELLSVMYETLSGRLIMTGCLLVYAAAFIWSEKILRFRV